MKVFLFILTASILFLSRYIPGFTNSEEKQPQIRWGRGCLLVPVFSWKEVGRMVSRLVSGITAESWEDAAGILSRYMEWEFKSYEA